MHNSKTQIMKNSFKDASFMFITYKEEGEEM